MARNKDSRDTVSAVIPTRNRPHLISRAVKSTLTQTLEPVEVIVVVDGPDEATVRALDQINDPKLKVVALPTHVGLADARNVGVNEAQGQWIAFLDDDDEWLPRKLEVQTEVASCSRYTFPIVTSRFIARTPKGEFVWPRRGPAPAEPLSEYLMTRRGLFSGETFIGTPMLLAKKELLVQVPFQSGLKRHSDWDWLLRTNTLEGVGLEFVPEPLVACAIQSGFTSVSTRPDWETSLAWIRENRQLVTPRAYSGFLITQVSPPAAQRGDWYIFWPLFKEIMRYGRPKPVDLLLYMGMWLIPAKIRRWLRALLTKKREG